MKREFCLFLFIGILFLVDAQSQHINFIATTDAKQIMVGSYFELNYSIENAALVDPVFPELHAFKVVSSPRKGSRVHIINGNKSTYHTFSLTLQAKKSGAYTISPATMKINGKTHLSNPLKIEVLNRTSKANNSVASTFIRLESNTPETYLGSQFITELKLYTTEAVVKTDVFLKPDFKDFYAREFAIQQTNPTKEVYLGREYNTYVLQRMLLMPQTLGKIYISPYGVDVWVDGGFGSSLSKYQSNTLKFKVNPLPVNSPESFSGAVGIFDISSTLNRTEADINDPLVLTVKISGEGDERRILAPKMNSSDSIEFFEPVLRSNQEESNRVERVFEYPMRIKFPGTYHIQVDYTYFNTIQKRYLDISSESTSLKVSDLKLNPTPGNFTLASGGLTQWFFFEYFVLVMFVVSFGAAIYLLFLLNKKKNIPILEEKMLEGDSIETVVRKNSAEILKEASRNLTEHKMDDFFKTINQSLESKLVEFTGAEDSSRYEMLHALSEQSEEELKIEFDQLFFETNAGLYGKNISQSDAAELLHRTEIFIAKLG
ncbi:MAG: BatD family protein [Saprospiraceae bacterium]